MEDFKIKALKEYYKQYFTLLYEDMKKQIDFWFMNTVRNTVENNMSIRSKSFGIECIMIIGKVIMLSLILENECEIDLKTERRNMEKIKELVSEMIILSD